MMRRALHVILLAAMTLAGAFSAARAQDENSNPASSSQYVSPGPRKSVEIGDFYFKRKRYAGALSRYKEAIQADPHYAPGYLGLGRVCEKLGMKLKALEAYQRYLDELPSKKDADEAKDVHHKMDKLRKEIATAPSPPARR